MLNLRYKPFRDEEGNTAPSGKLALPLSDFAPAKYFSNISGPLPTIEISYSMLASYLDAAEEQAAAEKDKDEEGAAVEEGTPVEESAAGKANQGNATKGKGKKTKGKKREGKKRN
jgi:hypothetical protein